MKLQVAQRLGTLAPSLALLVALLAVWFVLLPQMRAVSKRQSEIVALQSVVTARGREVDSLKKLTRQGGTVAKTLELLSLAAPAEAQVPELLVMVDTMARRANLTLINATPAAAAAGTRLDLSVKGSYTGMVDFLDLINRNLRPGTVKNFSIIEGAPAPSGQPAPSETVMSLTVEFIGGGSGAGQGAPKEQGGEP